MALAMVMAAASIKCSAENFRSRETYFQSTQTEILLVGNRGPEMPLRASVSPALFLVYPCLPILSVRHVKGSCAGRLSAWTGA